MLRGVLIGFVLLVAAIAGVAMAEVYIKKDTSNNQTFQKSEKTVESEEALQPQKTLEPQSNELKDLQGGETIPEEKVEAPAEPQLSIQQHANAYFENCVQQEHPILQGNNLELFCGCTSANMTKVMTPEQVKAMNTDTTEGQYQRNRMLLMVYTPCIEYPTRALIINSCTQQKSLRKPEKTCGCIADGMADFMNKNAPLAIKEAIERNQEDLDPLRLLLESPAYGKMERFHLQNCVAKFEEEQVF